MYQIGWAAANITPDSPAWLCGYAARTKPSEGVHEPICARACYLNDGASANAAEAALVSLDLVGIAAPQVREVRQRAAALCGVKNIVVGATHTHSAPVSCAQLEWEPAVLDAQWLERVVDATAKAVCRAKAAAVPSRLYAAFTRQADVAKNRRAGETAVDDALAALWARGEDGAISGFIVNYACHCTVLDSSNYLVSPDWPGYLYAGIKSRLGAEHTLFFNGAAGNLNIGYPADASALGVDMGLLRSYENAERKAALLADAIEQAMDSAVELEPRVRFAKVPLMLPVRDDLPGRQALAAELAALEQGGGGGVAAETRKIYLTSLLRNIDFYCPGGEEVILAESHLLALGRALAITVPAELFCEIGMEVKRAAGKAWMPMVFGYTDGYYGYLPTPQAFERGGYECETSVLSPATAAYLVETLGAAARRLAEGP